MKLLAKHATVWVEWTKTLPIESAFNRRVLENWGFVLLPRGTHFHFPVLDVIGCTRIDLHEVPIIAGVILDHRLGKGLGVPLVFEIMSPHARRNTVYWITSQCSINTFFFIHNTSFLSYLSIIAALTEH